MQKVNRQGQAICNQHADQQQTHQQQQAHSVLPLVLTVNVNFQAFWVNGNIQNIRTTANLTVFHVGLLFASAEVHKR
jgi:hypothetical protein